MKKSILKISSNVCAFLTVFILAAGYLSYDRTANQKIKGYQDEEKLFNQLNLKKTSQKIESSVIKKVIRQTVFVKSSSGSGTGVFVSDHCIVTNQHVVEDDDEIVIKTSNDKIYALFVLAKQKELDVVIACSEEAISKDWVKVGVEPEKYDFLFTIGNPLKHRNFMSQGMYNGNSWTSIPVAPGNSGGGVFTTDGIFVGIVEGCATSDGVVYSAVSKIVPVSTIVHFIEYAKNSYEKQKLGDHNADLSYFSDEELAKIAGVELKR